MFASRVTPPEKGHGFIPAVPEGVKLGSGLAANVSIRVGLRRFWHAPIGLGRVPGRSRRSPRAKPRRMRATRVDKNWSVRFFLHFHALAMSSKSAIHKQALRTGTAQKKFRRISLSWSEAENWVLPQTAGFGNARPRLPRWGRGSQTQKTNNARCSTNPGCPQNVGNLWRGIFFVFFEGCRKAGGKTP